MRTFAILSGAVVLLALSGCAAKQSGLVVKTDDWDDTLRIGEHVYHATRDTEFFGPDGERIELRQVPSLADPNIGVRHSPRAMVDFRASERAGHRYLERLWVRPR
ncbi:MAG: hypothetical protein ACR2P8_12365 [Myxococcota bacterium]